MLEGRCSKCGSRYFGWSLRFPRNQSCSKCGTALDIYEDGQLIATGYSPFAAEKYSLKVPDSAQPVKEGTRKKRATPNKKDAES